MGVTTYSRAELYDLIYGASEGDAPIVRRLSDRLAPGSRVLELACGTGRLLIPAVEESPHLSFTGLDLDREFLARSRQRAERSSISEQALKAGRLLLIEADMTRLRDQAALRPASFDLVVLAASSIVHVETERPPPLFHGVSRLLTERGAFFVSLTQAASVATGPELDSAEEQPWRLRASYRDRRPLVDIYQRDEVAGRQIRRTFRFHFLDTDRSQYLILSANVHSPGEIGCAAVNAGLVAVAEPTTSAGDPVQRTHWIFRKATPQ